MADDSNAGESQPSSPSQGTEEVRHRPNPIFKKAKPHGAELCSIGCGRACRRRKTPTARSAPTGPPSRRPAYTRLVPHGRVQFESGFTFNNEQTSASRTTLYDLPELAMHRAIQPGRTSHVLARANLDPDADRTPVDHGGSVVD